ncbi:hypothetical protein B0J13DRAFT_528088 [Dactylonectria estremocensis]|uniref:Zn(2)-C6 fungal-type domain-containing protein n=1 Tax=Dactylonectria estremocensis TaxID=1079267 RepID=A0A9P9EHA0_9HYPO|nr:hypothetical protein B0J13DRAFT_528088 [Dactylonectria estremocensis]
MSMVTHAEESCIAQSQSPPASPASFRQGDGRNAPRSRKGCWTCRTKKVKCDEATPQCRRCLRLSLLCDYAPRKRSSKSAGLAIQSLIRQTSTVDSGSNVACFQRLARNRLHALLEQNGPASLSTFSLPVPATGASSVVFTAADHESIRYFRTSFARLHHTKNPDYSLYSIMFRLAQVDPIIMHMILAVGGREMEFRRNMRSEDNRGVGSPLWHYSSALRMMADIVGDGDTQCLDLDSIHTALYLMLLYEQKYGDEKCSGVANHLGGASLILKHRCNDKLLLSCPSAGRGLRKIEAAKEAEKPPENKPLSLYSARLIVWIALFDAAAASCGVGGELNGTLVKLMSGSNTTESQFQPLENFDRLHRFSNPLYRTTWGEEYPQNELLDDVENRSVYSLLGACTQLRFMIAKLAKLYECDVEAAEERAWVVELSIQEVNNKFAELMEVAAELSLTTDNSHRLVANIRSIVPYFYAVVLDFLRLIRSDDETGLSSRQIDALRQIMNLAFQTYKHGGDEAMMRIAWPLFMVALETDDLLHREWALDRLKSISRFGANFERAHRFLVGVVDTQSRSGKRVNVRERFQSGEVGLFVI